MRRIRIISSAAMFERKGNPWYGDGRKGIPGSVRELTGHSLAVQTVLQQHGKKLPGLNREYAADIRDKYQADENAEIDAYTKATRAIPKEKYVDPQGAEIVCDRRRRLTNILMRRNKAVNNCRPTSNNQAMRGYFRGRLSRETGR